MAKLIELKVVLVVPWILIYMDEWHAPKWQEGVDLTNPVLKIVETLKS
jgi:hypothetical protein